jgi:hypothetical protein
MGDTIYVIQGFLGGRRQLEEVFVSEAHARLRAAHLDWYKTCKNYGWPAPQRVWCYRQQPRAGLSASAERFLGIPRGNAYRASFNSVLG